MCKGTKCPMKKDCYRYKAKPSMMQSYFLNPPIENGECKYFMKLTNPKK